MMADALLRVLFLTQIHEPVCVFQPWQVSSSRPCEEATQPDTIRPRPQIPNADTTTHQKQHNTNGSEKFFLSSTQNPSLRHRGLTLHGLIMLKSTSSMIPRSLQTSSSETGSVCGSSTSGQRSQTRGRLRDGGGVGAGLSGVCKCCAES